MATSSDLLSTMSFQSGGVVSRTDSWYGVYDSSNTPVFDPNGSFTSSGTSSSTPRTYFNFTSSDVGKVAIWVQALSTGFAGSQDLGSPVTVKTDTPTGWVSLFAASRDRQKSRNENEATIYTGIIASAKMITQSDVGSYYLHNNTADIDANNTSVATGLIIVDVNNKVSINPTPIVSVRSAWVSIPTNGTPVPSPVAKAVSSSNQSGPSAAIEIAAVTSKVTSPAQDLATVSLSNETGFKFLRLNGVVNSASTSNNGRTEGLIKYRVLRHVPATYYNQPTWSNPGNLYACGGYAVVKIGA